MIIFTALLHILCSAGLGVVSWIIVFIPFILMTVITALLLFAFKLDPKTGTITTDDNDIIIENEVVFGESHKKEYVKPKQKEPAPKTISEDTDKSKKLSELANKIYEESNNASSLKEKADKAREDAKNENESAIAAEKSFQDDLKELNEFDSEYQPYHEHNDLPYHTHDTNVEGYDNVYKKSINTDNPIKIYNPSPNFNTNIETFINNINSDLN